MRSAERELASADLLREGGEVGSDRVEADRVRPAWANRDGGWVLELPRNLARLLCSERCSATRISSSASLRLANSPGATCCARISATWRPRAATSPARRSMSWGSAMRASAWRMSAI